MKNENIVIAERHCVKHVLITIRNQKEIAFFCKNKKIFIFVDDRSER